MLQVTGMDMNVRKVNNLNMVVKRTSADVGRDIFFSYDIWDAVDFGVFL
jgi:hypothetical protein